MARVKSPAEVLLAEVIAQAISPTLKTAKFRKSALNYHRRLGESVQVVNIQVSHGSTAMEKTFYINAGMTFDSLCGLVGVPVLDEPKEYQCDRCGSRDRIGSLIPGAPSFWTIRAGEDTTEVVSALRGFVQQLVAELDQIDGLPAYRSHRWFDRFRPVRVNAQILYLLGDMEGARREVQHLTEFFADRPNGHKSDWWLEHLKLSGLKI